MKRLIRRILPKKVKVLLGKFLSKIVVRKAYSLDRKRFSKSAFNMTKKRNKDNLEAKITFHYHSLEKGLSNSNFRLGFGEYAYIQLIEAMQDFRKKLFNQTSIAYQSGLSVLNEYVSKHKGTEIDTTLIKCQLNMLSNSKPIKNLGGVFTFKKEELLKYCKLDFENLANHRFSVRDFGKDAVDINTIFRALDIAKKTPSVCNRQPWHSYIIRNKDLIYKVLSIQGGLTGQGKNLDTLLLICSNNFHLSNYTERNQGFADCGMYSMSLIYALQYLGLATCSLNANLTLNGDNKIRELLNIPFNQNLIMFIAVGHYAEEFKVPKSPRYYVKTNSTLIS